MHLWRGMRLDLDFEELDTLRMALDRAMKVMENELVHTEAPPLQHAIAADFEKLRRLRDDVIEQTTVHPVVDRPGLYRGM